MTPETTPPAAARRAARWPLAAAGLAAVALAGLLGLGARGWVGQAFPGFVLLPNRVIASVGLPTWSSSRDGGIYQHTVVAVNGLPVTDTATIYDLVARQPVGTPFTYTLRHDATTETVTLPSARFSATDYWAIFGAYLGSGLLYILFGLLGAWVLGERPLGRAVLLLGAVGGLYGLSAVDLYGPAGGLRLNALLETLLPAALAHTALALRRPRAADEPFVSLAWWLAVALAIPTQLLLHQPGAYSTLHAAAEGCAGVTSVGLLVSLILESARAGENHWLAPAKFGALLGLGVPGIVMALSSLSGGRLPVNVITATVFLFPLCFAYGLGRHALRTRRAVADPTPA